MTSPVSSSSSSSSSSRTAIPPSLSTAATSAASALPALLVPSPTNQPQPRSSPPVAEDQIENTLKCPICIDWFTDPILLDCSHSLCLDCARRLALHDGGTNTAEVTCPLCKEVTAVTGGDKAREMEDGLIADALKRFDVVPPRKSRARIEDLRTCYEAFIKNGLVAIGPNDAKPTALHMWRAVVARMESQTQDALGDKMSDSPSAASNAADATTSTGAGDEGEEGREGIDDPMKQLRFKKNILLANLVTHFREQQEQRASSPAPGFATSTSGFQQHQDQQQQQQDEQAYDEMFMDQGGEGSEDGEVTEDGEVRSAASSKVVGGEGGGAGSERGTSRWGGLSGKSDAAAIGSRHMWVGNLPNGVKEEHLRELFKGYGGVESVRMLRRTPQSMTGFLHFKETSEAIRAKKEMDGKPFVGGKLPQPLMKIQYQSRGVNKPLRSIRVHNLPPKTTSADLVELFSEFGRVEVAVINVASNIGFLALETVEQADRAMARWHDNVWRDRHLFIDYALRENISKEDPYLRGDRDRLGRDRERGGGGGGGDREREREQHDRDRDRDREREWVRERERERERSRDRGRERERERSRERMRDGRGGPPPPSRYDDRDRDRMRGPPPPPFPPGPPQHPPNRLLVLPSARGCPPFEVYAEDLEKLRELVELMQSHLAPHQRQTLEDALQNRALYEDITKLIGRNRGDMGAVLRDLRSVLGLPPIDHRRGPPPSPPHHHQHPPPPYHERPIPSHPRDRGPPMPPPPPLRDGPYCPPGNDRERGRDRMRYPSPPPPDYRHLPPPGHPDHNPHHHHHPPPHHYDRSPPRGGGGYRDDPRDYSPGRRGGGRLPPPPPPGYYDDRRGPPPPPPHPSSLGPPPSGYGGDRDRERSRDREREHGRDRERYGGGRGGMPSPPRGRRRSRSRSPPRGMMPPQLPPYPGDQGRKRSRDRAGNSLGRSRSRSLSPSSRRHRAEGGAGGDPRAAQQFPPGPPSQGRDSYPFPPNHPPPQGLTPGPPSSQRGGGAGAGAGAGGGGAPPPLKAECDQFLQSLTGSLGSGSGSAIGGNPPPPLSSLPASQSLTPGASASASSRIWLNSGNAATYACYDAALNLIKELLTPHYRAQTIDKDGFKRLAEEVTLLLVQQLLEHRLEGRADVPAHYKGVAENLVREALPKK